MERLNSYVWQITNFMGLTNYPTESWSEWLYKHLIHYCNNIIAIISCVVVIYGITNIYRGRKKKSSKRINKTEEYCRAIVEKIFHKPFPSVRPNWLNNPKTGRNLELDMFNEQLKLAFEYNGAQHVQYTPYYHNSREDFDKQVERDKLKNHICKQNGITLISIPHTIPKKKLHEYIIQQCKLSNIHYLY
jgi:hypothetical protein